MNTVQSTGRLRRFVRYIEIDFEYPQTDITNIINEAIANEEDRGAWLLDVKIGKPSDKSLMIVTLLFEKEVL